MLLMLQKIYDLVNEILINVVIEKEKQQVDIFGNLIFNLIIMKLFGWSVKKERWLSYKGGTFWAFWDNMSVNMSTYYKLYRNNSDLRRCVEEKQDTTWKGGYEIVTWYGETRKVIENKQIEEFLNNQTSLLEFKENFIRDLDVWANVFIEKVYNASGQLVWFDTLDPRTMSIISTTHWVAVKYIQRVSWSAVEFNSDEILHIKDKTDMDNELFWISKVETLVYDLMWDKEAAITNYSFFQNNAIPSSLVILENELDENEVKLAVENLKGQFSWGKNKHKVSVGNGIKDVKMLGTSSKDMEFYEYRKFNSERVCAVMGVPKTILNYTEWVNYSNADSQYTKFIENTIRPLETKFEIAITELLKEIAPEYRFEFIDTHINDLSDRVEITEKMLKNWLITLDEARERLDLPSYEWVNNSDKPLIINNYTLVEDLDINITPVQNEQPTI